MKLPHFRRNGSSSSQSRNCCRRRSIADRLVVPALHDVVLIASSANSKPNKKRKSRAKRTKRSQLGPKMYINRIQSYIWHSRLTATYRIHVQRTDRRSALVIHTVYKHVMLVCSFSQFLRFCLKQRLTSARSSVYLDH
ncbi:hypothetical protein Tcan_07676 [Toxocara canis]|uniref:Uncharacterized protein n=1 Tax=Toxocara canis TaxID=6265 RepID=A0A0B2VQN1_TOXCA|nr:hypothetical protein Tcan_07676 [Toxocara canis]